MKIVVTGREGQVVSALIEAATTKSDLTVVALGRPELDLAKPETIWKSIEPHAPDVIVSAAAYTAVDQAEDEPDLAFRINAEGAGAVAKAAAELGVPVIHLSTDYVFSGTGQRAYSEADDTDPTGIYGASKLAGEKAVALANPKHLIFRTAWVYSAFGKNFLKTMLKLAEMRDEISVVGDQWGNPTSAHELANAIVAAITHIHRPGFENWGTYHLTGTGDTNWSALARHIMQTSQRLGGPFATIRDIATADFPTKARRPANSRLSNDKFGGEFGWKAPGWRESVAEVVGRMSGQPLSIEIEASR